MHTIRSNCKINHYLLHLLLTYFVLRPYNYKFLKDYKCHCGKAYKTAQGLKAHSLLHNLRNQYDQRNNKSLLELSKFDQQQNTSKCIVETAAQLHIPEYQNDEYVRNWGNNEQFLKDFCNNWL